MTIDFPKFRKLLCHLRELLSGPCRIDYINGSDTFPPPLSKEEEQEVFAQLHAGSTEARETRSCTISAWWYTSPKSSNHPVWDWRI